MVPRLKKQYSPTWVVKDSRPGRQGNHISGKRVLTGLTRSYTELDSITRPPTLSSRPVEDTLRAHRHFRLQRHSRSPSPPRPKLSLFTLSG